MDLEVYSGQADLPERLCGEAFLSTGFELGANDQKTILYVDAASPENAADGSQGAPFHTLTDAFVHAEGETTIRVAVGSYEDIATFPAGVRVLGGYDAGDWTLSADPARVSRVGTIWFSSATDPKLISELSHFRVEGAISVSPKARVILRDNLLIPEPTPVMVTDEYPDPFAVSAVNVDEGFLRAQGNEVLLPTEEPEKVFSFGFNLFKSCARIIGNDVEAYRTPLAAQESEIAFNFNFVTEGENGVALTDSVASVTGSYFDLHGPPEGNTYAVYLVRSQPVLRYNEFHLSGVGSAGVDEGTANSDPLELVGNVFYLHSRARLLYLDQQKDGQGSTPRWLYDISDVNSLADIPVVSGNAAFYNP